MKQMVSVLKDKSVYIWIQYFQADKLKEKEPLKTNQEINIFSTEI